MGMSGLSARLQPWRFPVAAALGAILLALAGMWWLADDMPPPAEVVGNGPVDARVALRPIEFADLDGWVSDDHGEVFAAFRRSCDRLLAGAATPRAARSATADLAGACAAAPPSDAGRGTIRDFFESRFVPHEIVAESGLLTSYYEPVLDGSLERTETFRYPLYARPRDLVTRLDLEDGEMLPAGLNAARRTADGLVPYHTREDIGEGVLGGRGLELVWLADPVDVFFVHIQGSTRIRLPDGEAIRIGYAAKNGHPYRSAGQAMLADKVLPAQNTTAEGMKAWMRANPATARDYMNRNPSYVFFRVIEELDPDLGPVGGQGVPLTAGRSLAIDRSLYTYGLPFWIEARLPVGQDGAFERFNRLMIAQDTGAAITGPARGDIFWGTGPEAGEVAGRVKNAGRFVVLLPRPAVE